MIRILLPTGFGINCEAETEYAFRLVGARVDRVHLSDFLAEPKSLLRAQILVLAGGFSFGDHLGAGRVLANRLRTAATPELECFIRDGGLILGICNGFQAMARMGLVPSGHIGQQTVTLATNARAGYYDAWIRLAVDPDSPCVFTRGINAIDLPVRHGEGRLLSAPAILGQISAGGLAPVRYVDHRGRVAEHFPDNPNGSSLAIAGLCDPSGRIFGLMPHPDAFLYRENHPEWRHCRGPVRESTGIEIFRSGVEYCRGR
jgi:phosphoribosylformylglycinamidine synthase